MKTVKSVREILDNLIYEKCCKTREKNKFAPYEKAIDQTLQYLASLVLAEKKEVIKSPDKREEAYDIGYNAMADRIAQLIKGA